MLEITHGIAPKRLCTLLYLPGGLHLASEHLLSIDTDNNLLLQVHKPVGKVQAKATVPCRGKVLAEEHVYAPMRVLPRSVVFHRIHLYVYAISALEANSYCVR